jgi:hypothetical protein
MKGIVDMTRLFCEDLNLKPADESFVQGWKEAVNDESLPVEQLWEEVESSREWKNLSSTDESTKKRLSYHEVSMNGVHLEG